MAKKKHRTGRGKTARRSKRPTDRISVRRVSGRDAFELVPPPCVLERAEDMAEVHVMIEAGEVEIAVEELQWLVGGCHALLEAHQLLGEIAIESGDLSLAQSHLGHAVELGWDALSRRKFSGTLPYERAANRPFLAAAAAMARCFEGLNQPEMAAEIARKLLALDPSDPLDVRRRLGVKRVQTTGKLKVDTQPSPPRE